MITVTNLRKIFTAQGVKGASSWKREDFNAFITGDERNAYAEDAIVDAERAAAAKDAARTISGPVAKAPKHGVCEDCGRKVGNSGHPTLCEACHDYAGWENTHSDEGHGTDRFTGVPTDTDVCPICHPELDPRSERRTGKSRAGMVIVAVGSEIHKSLLFKREAEAKGWTVEISKETYEMAEDATGEGTRHYATATRGDDSISLAWDGRAYDYAASSAEFAGKARKVRNLKEALRLI